MSSSKNSNKQETKTLCDEECFWFRIGECNSKTKTCEKPEHYQTGSEDY